MLVGWSLRQSSHIGSSLLVLTRVDILTSWGREDNAKVVFAK